MQYLWCYLPVVPVSLCRSDPDEERGVEEMGGEERQRTKQATREAVRDFVVRMRRRIVKLTGNHVHWFTLLYHVL